MVKVTSLFPLNTPSTPLSSCLPLPHWVWGPSQRAPPPPPSPPPPPPPEPTCTLVPLPSSPPPHFLHTSFPLLHLPSPSVLPALHPLQLVAASSLERLLVYHNSPYFCKCFIYSSIHRLPGRLGDRGKANFVIFWTRTRRKKSASSLCKSGIVAHEHGSVF